MKAVEFAKTSVTYCSLGQSVQPMGKVDNFFVAVMCRKFFKDQHPRQSKKHFFYLKVGVSSFFLLAAASRAFEFVFLSVPQQCLSISGGEVSCDSAMGLSFLYVAFCHVYFFPFAGLSLHLQLGL